MPLFSFLTSCKKVYENKDWNLTYNKSGLSQSLLKLQKGLRKQGLKLWVKFNGYNTKFCVAKRSTKTRIETNLCKRAYLPPSLRCKKVYENKDWNKSLLPVILPLLLVRLQKGLRKQGLKQPLYRLSLSPESSCKKVYENKDWNALVRLQNPASLCALQKGLRKQGLKYDIHFL